MKTNNMFMLQRFISIRRKPKPEEKKKDCELYLQMIEDVPEQSFVLRGNKTLLLRNINIILIYLCCNNF